MRLHHTEQQVQTRQTVTLALWPLIREKEAGLLSDLIRGTLTSYNICQQEGPLSPQQSLITASLTKQTDNPTQTIPLMCTHLVNVWIMVMQSAGFI